MVIRYPITANDLNSRIDAVKDTWRTRAAKFTRDLENGTRSTVPGIWSEIKKVYEGLQGAKCAFCEKWVEKQPIEQDVEHFRPKNNVKRWSIPHSLAAEQIIVNQPDVGSEPGYRLLAYHPLNYVIACKTCNSILKRDYFPIAGSRQSNAKDPATCRAERPYLIFPLGTIDDDPEDLIEFRGLNPRPTKLGFDRQRAMVTIEIFKLDSQTEREDLLHERAAKIEYLYFALKMRDDGNSDPADVTNAKNAIVRLTSPRSPHTNCLRCFQRLWDSDNVEARNVYTNVATYLEGTSA